MSRWAFAVRLGLRRGWIMFRHVITTTDGIANTAIWNGIPLALLMVNRNEMVEGTDLSMAAVALPGWLGLLIAASAFGPAYYIAAEREDGTVLRAKAVPYGIVGYVTGTLFQASLETLLGIAIILVPGFLFISGLAIGSLAQWFVFGAVVILGLLASLPVGVIIGSLVRSPRLIGIVGFLVIGAMAVVSGIFVPLQEMPQWAQVIGQLLPPYWIGLGLRFVFLPEAAVALEIGQSWRHLEMIVVLGAWATAGCLAAPAGSADGTTRVRCVGGGGTHGCAAAPVTGGGMVGGEGLEPPTFSV